MSKKTLRSLYLDIEQTEKLKELSAKTKVPQAVYIREGIDLVLKRHSKKISKVKSSKHAALRLLKNDLK